MEYVISKKRLKEDCWVTDSLAVDCRRYLCGKQSGDHLWFDEDPLHSDTEEAEEGQMEIDSLIKRGCRRCLLSDFPVLFLEHPYVVHILATPEEVV